ncbi:hypothetical protein QY917_04015 [Diaphorobacter sp. C33]|uniref:hypothetical protein n=1 Tax=Diaphorobacter TaxID=238749 RepID=UPI0011CEBD8A|nr:hypothetical protein [Diaphorobacter sp. C33]WKK90329.1 hypothetical protein QY917_04015 [Diaphorobacter sp. C33]
MPKSQANSPRILLPLKNPFLSAKSIYCQSISANKQANHIRNLQQKSTKIRPFQRSYLQLGSFATTRPLHATICILYRVIYYEK